MEVIAPPGSGQHADFGMIDIQLLGVSVTRIDVAFPDDLHADEKAALKAAAAWTESRIKCLKTHLKQAF
jgi:hypothetical protein